MTTPYEQLQARIRLQEQVKDEFASKGAVVQREMRTALVAGLCCPNDSVQFVKMEADDDIRGQQSGMGLLAKEGLYFRLRIGFSEHEAVFQRFLIVPDGAAFNVKEGKRIFPMNTDEDLQHWVKAEIERIDETIRTLGVDASITALVERTSDQATQATPTN
jgi:hypothetical protein